MVTTKMKKAKTLEDQLYNIGLIFLVLGCLGIFVYYRIVLRYFEMPPCTFLSVLGFYCPGCGGTRAVAALLHGHLLHSLWYHPLVMYIAVVAGGFMVTQTLERCRVPGIKGWKYHDWYMYGMIVILVVNWITKNILLHFFRITL